MKRFKGTFLILSGIILGGLVLFAFYRNYLGPKIASMVLCKKKEACIHGLTLGENGPHTLAYSEDGTYLIGIGYSGARLWDVENNYREKRLSLSGAGNLAVSDTGQFAITQGKDQIYLFDATGEQQLEFLTKDQNLKSMTAIAFVPGNNLLATAGDGLRLWNTQNGSPITQLPHKQVVSSIATSSSGLIAAGQQDGKIILWPLDDFRNYSTLPAFQDPIRELAFHPDGKRLAVAGPKGQIALFDVSTKQRIHTFQHQQAAVSEISFSKDGRYLAAAYRPGLAVLWEVETGGVLLTLDHPRKLDSLALSPDGSQVAIALEKEAVVNQGKSRRGPKLNYSTGDGTRIKPGVTLIKKVDPIAPPK